MTKPPDQDDVVIDIEEYKIRFPNYLRKWREKYQDKEDMTDEEFYKKYSKGMTREELIIFLNKIVKT